MADEDSGGMCGFALKETYDLALRFMHEKDGSKAVAIGYEDKLRLSAYTKQASKGAFDPAHCPEVGFLDRIGNDRREAWRGLGDMPREKAMNELVQLVDRLSPLFRPYLEAHQASRLEQERIRQEVYSQDQNSAESEVLARQAAEYQRWLEHEANIRTALNEQTAVQFKHYAEQQYPNEPERQQELIKQLQEQHFQQFMTHWYQQQQLIAQQQQQNSENPQQQQQSIEATISSSETNGQMATVVPPPQVVPVANLPISGITNGQSQQQQQSAAPAQVNGNGTGEHAASESANAHIVESDVENGEKEKTGGAIQPIPLAPVRLWTHKNVKQFRETIKKENSEAIIKIGSGESITIRVPTNSDATSLYWEFMTDGYDIGFGVFFEWQQAEDDQVRIQLSDSEDDDDDEDGGPAYASGDGAGDDVEKEAASNGNKRKEGPPVDELVVLSRRDSHLEVQCGSHDFAPACGVYLLRFDNSYSLWRSKTLYYRIYYAK